MKHIFKKTILLAFAATVLSSQVVRADSAEELDRKGRVALWDLYKKNPKALAIAKKAYAVLVFPSVVKAGFIFGAQRGDGVLVNNQGTVGYYNTTAVSYGLQAGVQEFGYALFFMNPAALSYLDKSGGWEVGTGPTLVVVDSGYSKSLSTTTLTKDIYAFFFDQKGLMGGLGFQGTKISPYTPSQ